MVLEQIHLRALSTNFTQPDSCLALKMWPLKSPLGLSAVVFMLHHLCLSDTGVTQQLGAGPSFHQLPRGHNHRSLALQKVSRAINSRGWGSKKSLKPAADAWDLRSPRSILGEEWLVVHTLLGNIFDIIPSRMGFKLLLVAHPACKHQPTEPSPSGWQGELRNLSLLGIITTQPLVNKPVVNSTASSRQGLVP